MSLSMGSVAEGQGGEGGDGEVDDAFVQREYGEWAAEVFRLADSNRNGDLSINELKVMLAGTEHQGFTEWMFFYRSEMFKIFDKDGSGSLELPEMARALRMFHQHVRSGESQPLANETADETVARNMLEYMYKHAAVGQVPSFVELFDRVDVSRDGTLQFHEVERMIRKDLGIPKRKISKEGLKFFFSAIDRDGGGLVERDEFVRFMMAKSRTVSISFVHFPPPPEGKANWGDADPDDPGLGLGFDFGYHKPYWLVPKTYAEMAAEVRAGRRIGGFTSLKKNGVSLAPRKDPHALPTEPELPDIHTALATQISHLALLKEKRENTAWDLSGPRYQVTKKPLEEYHEGRVLGHDGFWCPTRLGGVRPRHHEPLRDAHGALLGRDEVIFHAQKGKSNCAEPLFMETLPPTFGVYDRLCNVTTTSRLMAKIAYSEDLKRAKSASGKRKGSKPGFAPL